MAPDTNPNPEAARLDENRSPHAPWHRWGPYLSDRQWGTVREDYSADGSAWDYFPHDHARSRAYRWGEDGLFGFCDRHGLLCLSFALWNGKDPILKERLFGLTNAQGNHGEDVKECYFHEDGLPSHAYMRALYKYPQAAFPYDELVEVNGKRPVDEPEYELADTGVFDEERYFDVEVEYAKQSPDAIAMRLTVTNRGPDTAELVVMPHLWFRNTWSWSEDAPRPKLRQTEPGTVKAEHPRYGAMTWWCEGEPTLLFTENESNAERLFGEPNATPYVKDAFHATVVDGDETAVCPDGEGTKVAALIRVSLKPGESQRVRATLGFAMEPAPKADDLDALFATRKKEADAFYAALGPHVPEDPARVQRSAVAGLLWSKQHYRFVVHRWLDGDPTAPPPPASRLKGRDSDWRHLHADDVLSVPDKWEFSWFAAWDLAFQSVAYALVDPAFGKFQLTRLVEEAYLHPNGQMPAYEWAFGDANPPVHAWAAWRVYTIDRRITGVGDREFLERMFLKLLLNFTWWVNQKDQGGNNVFEGGFLGLDNIGVFDRNAALSDGSFVEQADGTSWMAMYCLDMFTIAVELAESDAAYEDLAAKFLDHFLYIAEAMNKLGSGTGLWDEDDGFFYDVLARPDGAHTQLRIRSIVGLIPLFASTTLEADRLERLPVCSERLEWFQRHLPDLMGNVASFVVPGQNDRRLLSVVDEKKLRRILARMLDEDEFLSPYGIRSLSKAHAEHPFELRLGGETASVDYEPGESRVGTFGGNSNWRGPVWFPLNFLIIEALQRLHYYHGDAFQVEMPTGSGHLVSLDEVAKELERRLLALFLDSDGQRPYWGGEAVYARPEWRNHLWFNEYFHGDTGRGLGASHQTGWTALVAKLVEQFYVTAYGGGG
ncbi:MAG: hypothetical protein M9921_06935 [Fimbriimonadaceae bacterium]|nr:hypothetical protein [Fimbriimonadaceae bacterium]